MSALGDLGGNILDTIGDVVGGFGDKITNKVDADSARIEYLRTTTAIAAAEAAANAQRKKQITSAIIIVVYLVAFAGVGLAIWKTTKN